MGEKIGICTGTWLITSLVVFLITAIQKIKIKKYLKGSFLFLLGAFIGLLIETLQILPSFVYLFKFQDFQAFAVIGASVLIIPVSNMLMARKEVSQ